MASAPPVLDLSDVDSGDETGLFLTIDGTEVEIGEIVDLPELPSGTQTMFETTHMRSGEFKEWKKNRRRDGNEVAIVGNYVIASESETHLRAAEDTKEAIQYRIEIKQGAVVYDVVGFALFRDLVISNPMEDRRQFTITAKWVSRATTTAQG
jgi:hypothetical protein